MWYVAYIDPGSGSYVFQLILGAFFGALVAIKIYWQRFRAFVMSLFSKKR